MLARCSVATFYVTDFHSVRQHAGETERYTFRVLLAMHGHLETITEIDVHNLAGDPVQHQVGRMAITKTEDITDHGHYGERACVIRTTIKPRF